jgi:hypothetical protein
MSESNLDIILNGSLDQPVPLDWGNGVLDRIDQIIQQAITEKNGWLAVNALVELRKVAMSSGIGLAKFIHDVVTNWDKFGIDDNVYAVLQDQVGITKYTIDRYTLTWESLNDPKITPPQYAHSILERGIAASLNVALMLKKGVEPTNEQWEDLVNAPDKAALNDTIREISGEEVSPNKIYIQMELTGEIYVYHLNQKHYVGKLDTASGVYAVQKAVDRMCLGGGVSRK